MLVHQRMNTLCRIQQAADRSIVIQGVDQVCNILAHIDFRIPRSGKQLWTTVGQVCGKDTVDQAIRMRLIELIAPLRKEAKGSEVEDSLSALCLQLQCNVDQGITGSDHIINDDDSIFFNEFCQRGYNQILQIRPGT